MYEYEEDSEIIGAHCTLLTAQFENLGELVKNTIFVA